MSDENLALGNHIFFLKLSETLPENYFHLAQQMARWNITLVPLTFAQWQEIPRHDLQFIMALVCDLKSRQAYNAIGRQFLSLANFSKRLCLFDINSFGRESALNILAKNNNYYYFPLPGKLGNICKAMATVYYQLKKGKETWPGGRRFRLPGLVSTV
ncbi:MAG: hypothetical protein WCG27_09225 [Pseudomonadota bacterium]